MNSKAFRFELDESRENFSNVSYEQEMASETTGGFYEGYEDEDELMFLGNIFAQLFSLSHSESTSV